MRGTESLPANVPDLAGLHPYDYDETFTVALDWTDPPEAWARHAMEGAPPWMRAVMVNGWRLLTIHLAPLDSTDAVLGWSIRTSTPDVVVLGVESTLGLTARIVGQTQPGRITHSMLVRFETTAARVAWAAIAPGHRAFVRRLLHVAARAARPIR